MGSNGTQGKTIKSTRTAFDIIEAVAELDRPTVSEIAENVDHSRSTVHYHLNTLKQERYVIADEDGFRLGLRMARFGVVGLQTHPLSDVAEKPADDLAAETEAAAHIAVPEGGKLVWLYRSIPEADADLPTAVGEEVPMHATAYGQAMLAHQSADAVSDLIDEHGLSAITSETLTDRLALEERLETVRDLGFAYSDREFADDYCSIAAPIVDGDESVLGAIGITARHDRIDDPYKHAKARRFSDQLPDFVRRAAQIASDRYADR